MYTEDRQVGSQYEATKDKSVKEIASLIRSEVRKATKQGTIPAEWDYSVRLHRFAGGQSIDIAIAIPDAFRELRFVDQDAHNLLEATKDFVREIHESFNFYESYFPNDGCARRYFGDVSTWRKAGV